MEVTTYVLKCNYIFRYLRIIVTAFFCCFFFNLKTHISQHFSGLYPFQEKHRKKEEALQVAWCGLCLKKPPC